MALLSELWAGLGGSTISESHARVRRVALLNGKNRMYRRGEPKQDNLEKIRIAWKGVKARNDSQKNGEEHKVQRARQDETFSMKDVSRASVTGWNLVK